MSSDHDLCGACGLHKKQPQYKCIRLPLSNNIPTRDRLNNLTAIQNVFVVFFSKLQFFEFSNSVDLRLYHIQYIFGRIVLKNELFKKKYVNTILFLCPVVVLLLLSLLYHIIIIISGSGGHEHTAVPKAQSGA